MTKKDDAAESAVAGLTEGDTIRYLPHDDKPFWFDTDAYHDMVREAVACKGVVVSVNHLRQDQLTNTGNTMKDYPWQT